MVQQFFVFVRAKPGHAHSIAMRIAKRRFSSVKEISSISGPWDLLLRVEIDSRLNVAAELIDPLSKIEDVERTETIVGYATYDPASLALDDDFD